MKKLTSITCVLICIIFVFSSCASMIKNPAIHVLTKSEIEAQKNDIPSDIVEEYINSLQNLNSKDEIMNLYNQLTDYKIDDELIDKTNDKLKQIALSSLNPLYIDVEGDEVNIYKEALDYANLESISNSDISILLNWLDENRAFSEENNSYTIAGSKEERQVLFTAIKIEDKFTKMAIESEDTSIINKYFENNPYSLLPNDPNEEGRYRAWENVEKELIAYCEETIVYNKAISTNNAEIYTSKYKDGRYDVSNIEVSIVESE